MSNDVWIGALISVPIGIATGLAVGPIQRWMDTRGKNQAIKEMTRRKSEYQEVLLYLKNPNTFTQYLIIVAVRTTFIGAAVGIFSGLLYAMENVGDYGPLPRLLGVLAQMITVASSVVIVLICRPAIRMWYRVRNFDSYVHELPSGVRDTTAEASVKMA